MSNKAKIWLGLLAMTVLVGFGWVTLFHTNLTRQNYFDERLKQVVSIPYSWKLIGNNQTNESITFMRENYLNGGQAQVDIEPVNIDESINSYVLVENKVVELIQDSPEIAQTISETLSEPVFIEHPNCDVVAQDFEIPIKHIIRKINIPFRLYGVVCAQNAYRIYANGETQKFDEAIYVAERAIAEFE